MPARNNVKLLLVGVVCFVGGYLVATVQPHSTADPMPPAKAAVISSDSSETLTSRATTAP